MNTDKLDASLDGNDDEEDGDENENVVMDSSANSNREEDKEIVIGDNKVGENKGSDKTLRPGPTQRAKKRASDEELAILKSLAATIAAPETSNQVQDDEDSTYGRYVASELRQVTDTEVKLILKNTISNAIFNARMQQNNKRSGPSPLSERNVQWQQPQCPQTMQHHFCENTDQYYSDTSAYSLTQL